VSPESARPLFIVGNKRSGTSLLVRLLNLHPRIFVSHESDIVWILYQFHERKPFEPHPWDSGRGMGITLSTCRSLLSLDRTPLENFYAVQTAMMRAGNPWLPALRKDELDWIGDKKPFQHGDPRLVDFILLNLPRARFIHLVRHPFQVVASVRRFNRTANGDFWKELSGEEQIERWLFHEERVLDLKRRVGEQLIDVRYEDLCKKPAEEMARLLTFLEVDQLPPQSADDIKRQTLPPRRRAPAITCSDRSRAVAELYGYSLAPPGKAGRLAFFWSRLMGRV